MYFKNIFKKKFFIYLDESGKLIYIVLDNSSDSFQLI